MSKYAECFVSGQLAPDNYRGSFVGGARRSQFLRSCTRSPKCLKPETNGQLVRLTRRTARTSSKWLFEGESEIFRGAAPVLAGAERSDPRRRAHRRARHDGSARRLGGSQTTVSRWSVCPPAAASRERAAIDTHVLQSNTRIAHCR